MKWKNKGQELDLLAGKIIESAASKKFYIWGAGYFGDTIYHSLKNQINILGYIDSNKNKWHMTKNNLKIAPPSVLNEVNMDDACVLVSAGWTREIFDALSGFGYKKNINCFHIDEFYSIFMLFKNNKLCLSVVSISISERCTLKCEKCSTFIPYIQKPINFSIESVIKELDTLFHHVDYVSSLTVNGGDAMCSMHCREIIEQIAQKYLKKNIGMIELCTNAVIVPDSQFLETLKKYNVCLRFTDYALEAKQNIEEVKTLLIANSIKYDHVRFESWRDMGYPQESNGIHGEDALQAHFTNCDRRSCQLVFGEKYFYCGQAIGADRIGYSTIGPDDYFDLKEPFFNKYEFLEFALGFSSKGYLSYCKKCNGGFNCNDLRVPAGVQIKN